jgi:peptidoglycan hydrolase-like protein with peptidoglycan-binding domain
VELYRLRPARDLTLGDVLERSVHYSELRRRAVQRTAMPRPSVAIGGISALALVAGSTLPSLLGGGRAAKKERIAYAADVHSQARTDAGVAGTRSASAPVATTHASRNTSRTGSGTARAAASKATSRAARPSSAAAVSSSGGTGLASTASVKPGGASIKLVSDHTSNVTPAVSAVQQVQHRLGVDPVDGSFGAMTEQAVKQFQASHGLAANGVVGVATRTALGIGPGPTLTPDVPTVDPAPVSGRVTKTPVTLERPPVVQEQQASPTNTVHDTGGVPTQTVPARHPTPVHTTPPTTETTTGSTQSTQSAPSGDVQSGVQRMIAAGNRIATRPYVYGGGHASFNSRGYDCSGSVSYVLHAAGLLKSPEDSTELESYGKPGPGRYVSIYANSGHAWMTIQGRRFDTVAQAQTGSRWSNHTASTSGFVVRHPTHY